MGENTRFRKKQLLVHMFEEEHAVLCHKAKEAGMTVSDFVRSVVLFGNAYSPARWDGDVKGLVYEMNRIGNNVNQIAYKCNAQGGVFADDVERLKNSFNYIFGVVAEKVINGGDASDGDCEEQKNNVD